jgi:hypothetical protein
MKRRSPTLAGFSIALSSPSFGLAEIAWRWSFGFAAALLLMFSVVEYLDTLPVTSRDELMFRTRQPALISRAISHILRGSSLRVIVAGVLLAIALSFAWIILGALGRSATVSALLEHFHASDDSPQVAQLFHFRSLLGLNFLRAVATLAAIVGCVAAFLAGGAASPPDNSSPGSAMMVCLFIMMLIALAWCMLNWFLSLAAISVVAEGRDTFSAITGVVGLFRDRTGPILAANTWFGLAHLVVFFIAISVAGFPLALAGLLPAGIVSGGILLVALLYFGAVDFLYVGRLASYIVILKAPEPLPQVEIPKPFKSDPASNQFSSGIDRNELILSDLPNLLPEA